MSINAIQYIGLFAVWIATMISAAICLAAHGWRRHWYVVGVMWASVWYLAIQAHWVMSVADSISTAVEWWWSLFETLVGVLLYSSLPAHCSRPLPTFLKVSPPEIDHEQRPTEPAP